MTLLSSAHLSFSTTFARGVEGINTQGQVAEPSFNRQSVQAKRGRHLLNDKQYEAALHWYRQAVIDDPDSAEAWHGQGEALASLGSYGDALISLNRAIELHSTVSNYWITQAVVLIHLHDYLGALDSCERALAIEPGNREAWLFHGSALQRLGRYRDAYASFDKAAGVQRQSLSQKVAGLFSHWL
ncbi:MAG: tetratricopeptide repeat protein [Leptolyngbyaceae cyanobacterium]